MISTLNLKVVRYNRLIFILVSVVGTASAGGVRLSLPSAWSATAEWRVDGEVNVLLRVQPNHEGRDVHELLSDTDVTMTDHDTGVVDRLGEAKLEHLCLETPYRTRRRRSALPSNRRLGSFSSRVSNSRAAFRTFARLYLTRQISRLHRRPYSPTILSSWSRRSFSYGRLGVL